MLTRKRRCVENIERFGGSGRSLLLENSEDEEVKIER